MPEKDEVIKKLESIADEIPQYNHWQNIVVGVDIIIEALYWLKNKDNSSDVCTTINPR